MCIGRLAQACEGLNIVDHVDSLLADYSSREGEFRELVPDADEIELSLVCTFPGQVGVMLTGSTADWVVADVGLSRTEAQVRDLDFVLEQLGGRAELTRSREELEIADGDLVFVFGNADELFADPLWGALDAVQRVDVYEVGYHRGKNAVRSEHRKSTKRTRQRTADERATRSA